MGLIVDGSMTVMGMITALILYLMMWRASYSFKEEGLVYQPKRKSVLKNHKKASQVSLLSLISFLMIFTLGAPQYLQAGPKIESLTDEEALRLGEEFGIIVGEVDEEIQEFLGLERPEGVVVFEVIGGRPAALAGIKPRALIKEINSVEVRNLKDFGLALREALPKENFTVATYEPPDPDNQGMSGGINFHFVRVEKI